MMTPLELVVGEIQVERHARRLVNGIDDTELKILSVLTAP
jgi:hypothetical protein